MFLPLVLGAGLACGLRADVPVSRASTPASPVSPAAGGSAAVLALIRRADQTKDLEAARGLLLDGARLGGGSAAGSEAALDLAELDYADGRPADALAFLDASEGWPRDGAAQPEWFFWRGQCRLALKQWRGAEQDFGQLLAVWPRGPRAESGRLGEADCQVALGQDEAAADNYEALAEGRGRFAAQALWGLGSLRQNQKRWGEARGAFERLERDYPSSFEAQGAKRRLAHNPGLRVDLAHRIPQPRGLWSVQVGAFSSNPWAAKLARHLRQRRFRARIRKATVDGRVFYLVQVGPYRGRSAALVVAERLKFREKLPFNLVQE